MSTWKMTIKQVVIESVWRHAHEENTDRADSSFFIRCAVFSLALMYSGLFLFSSASCTAAAHIPNPLYRVGKKHEFKKNQKLRFFLFKSDF